MTRSLALAPVLLGIFGDPIVSRALMLLLRGPRYDARLLPASSGVVEALDGVQLVLPGSTPQLSARRRKTLVASLVERAVVAGIPILELVPSGRAREEEWRAGRGEVSWPCNFGELERGIEDALRAHHGEYWGTRQHPPAGTGQAYS